MPTRGMRFVESCPLFSWYELPSGERVREMHRTFSVDMSGVDWSDITDLFHARWFDASRVNRWGERGEYMHAWDRSRPVTANYNFESFRVVLSRILPDVAEEMVRCASCDMPTHTEYDAAESVNDGYDIVCRSCLETYYYWCDSCEEYRASSNETPDGQLYCDSCMESCYEFCSDCDGYFSREEEHTHDDDYCESPVMSFSLKNDGQEMLKNDTRISVSLPSGVIDEEGMAAISRMISNNYWAEGTAVPCSYGNSACDMVGYEGRVYMTDVAALLPSLGNQWQTKEGNFTKRLSRAVHKQLGKTLPAAVVSEVGNIANAHCQGKTFDIETTRDLNMSAEDFYHGDSCWWQSYYQGRCALKTNGGFGLRSFNEYGDVSGRVWVMPLKRTATSFVPTFETESPDAFMVFNGYGALGGYTPARILSHMYGWTYRKVGFGVDLDHGTFYVNAGGYLVASEDIASNYTDGSVYMSCQQHSNLYNTETREKASNVA